MTKVVRYKENPFIEGMSMEVGSKLINVSTLGKDNNILVSQVTGEVTGTHVVARKRVDKAKFVKAFSDYMAFTFDLTKAGNKALRVVMWAAKEYAIGKDKVDLGRYMYEEFLETYADSEPPLVLSYSTYNRGLAELEKAKIIAKTMRTGHYFLNPDCLFNGDRIAFTTILERKPKRDPNTIDMLSGVADNEVLNEHH
jgi:hypothetical protein